ncbi:hypothetical protein NQ318_019213 [Aromia moschata]|uniref:Mos1 transposase HTH domain-containing protein n=1 Tax=Aromia moschata TaxID=1265417 RepID=A0AAV8YYT3_9CUCU|nr:hypothetical protein NQ318_019213 [Aromia moschata]
MLSVQMEQRVNLKCLVKLGKTFTEAYAMLKVYGNECLSRTQVFEWFKRSQEGCETTEDVSNPKPHLVHMVVVTSTVNLKMQVAYPSTAMHKAIIWIRDTEPLR